MDYSCKLYVPYLGTAKFTYSSFVNPTFKIPGVKGRRKNNVGYPFSVPLVFYG